jgi:DNA polymerase elongation subunit (family B)
VKILILDIETSPNIAHVWGLFKQTVSLSQLMASSRVLCVAAKWVGQKETYFFSEFDGAGLSKAHHNQMIRNMWDMIDEADAVIHYNGSNFDMPILNGEFERLRLGVPAPYKNIDLCQTVKKTFRLTSAKLEYVLKHFEIGAKVSHTGHQLWVDCLNGDPKAWALMEKYNRGDVVPLEKLYKRLLPWMKGHPNVNLYLGTTDMCTNCGSASLVKRGFAYTAMTKFQRLRCTDCGTWMRSNKRLDASTVTQVKG